LNADRPGTELCQAFFPQLKLIQIATLGHGASLSESHEAKATPQPYPIKMPPPEPDLHGSGVRLRCAGCATTSRLARPPALRPSWPTLGGGSAGRSVRLRRIRSAPASCLRSANAIQAPRPSFLAASMPLAAAGLSCRVGDGNGLWPYQPYSPLRHGPTGSACLCVARRQARRQAATGC
jgi:hypothetical protein